ncbi:MAG: NrsF family protein [Pseudomonadota bacterium]
MKTQELIRRLAEEAAPVPRHALHRRFAIGLGFGAAAAFAAVASVYGVRPDIATAFATTPMLIKSGLTLSLAVGSGIAALHLAHPEARLTRRSWIIVLPILIGGAIAAVEISSAPQSAWPSMVMGQSAPQCLARVALVSIPLFAGLVWSFRKFAPTDLRAAGAALGGLSGALAAFLYALHCRESAAVFIALWYSLGVVLMALAGAALGPRLLRW